MIFGSESKNYFEVLADVLDAFIRIMSGQRSDVYPGETCVSHFLGDLPAPSYSAFSDTGSFVIYLPQGLRIKAEIDGVILLFLLMLTKATGWCLVLDMLAGRVQDGLIQTPAPWVGQPRQSVSATTVTAIAELAFREV